MTPIPEEEDIVFDGSLNESLWESLLSLSFSQHSPNYGTEPNEQTVLKITHDDSFMYVGAMVFYSNGAEITNFTKKRDGAGGPTDWIAFAIDGFNDHTNGLGFATTPAGLRWDAAITVSASGISVDDNWNTYWEVKTNVKDRFWEAEFKIPLSSLRFKEVQGQAQMTMIAWRITSSTNEIQTFPAIPPVQPYAFADITKGKPFEFRNIKESNPIYVSPYVLMGYKEDKILQPSATSFETHPSGIGDVGLDMKYNITSNLILDATINTDFAQVEVDNFQINLERESLFFPEKREFFLERSNNFQFNFEGNNGLFYSRRIGFENGEIQSIYGGIRLTGRLGKWDVGGLNLFSENAQVEDIQNLGVVRIKRQLGNGNNYVGGIVTSRLGVGELNSLAAGVDSQFEVISGTFVKTAFASSMEDNLAGVQGLNQARYVISFEKPSDEKFFYRLQHSLIGEDYSPVLGFEARGNISTLLSRMGYGWYSENDSNIFKRVLSSQYQQITGYSSGDKESVSWWLNYDTTWKNGMHFSIAPEYREERLVQDLLLSATVSIPAGDYDFKSLNLGYSAPSTKALFGSVSLNLGEFYDGTRITSSLYARLNTRAMQFRINYRYDRIRFSDRQQLLENHIVYTNTLWTLSTSLSFNGLIQYDTQSKQVSSNLRFRFNPKEGNDLFLVFNALNNTDINRMPIPLPEVNNWIVQLKYRHTFGF